MTAKQQLANSISESGLSRRQWYRKVYLKSDHWQNLRVQKLKQQGTCETCQSAKRLDIHHLRYRSVFNVELQDLMVLCRSCHKKEHRLIANKRGLNRPLWSKDESGASKNGVPAHLMRRLEQVQKNFTVGSRATRRKRSVDALIFEMITDGTITPEVYIQLQTIKSGRKQRKNK